MCYAYYKTYSHCIFQGFHFNTVYIYIYHYNNSNHQYCYFGTTPNCNDTSVTRNVMSVGYDLINNIDVLMVDAGMGFPELNGLEGQSKDLTLKPLNGYE